MLFLQVLNRKIEEDAFWDVGSFEVNPAFSEVEHPILKLLGGKVLL
ncbi:MAG: hypothetical protein ACXQS6_05145 [Candidatus Syntropharchaeales archaeon]